MAKPTIKQRFVVRVNGVNAGKAVTWWWDTFGDESLANGIAKDKTKEEYIAQGIAAVMQNDGHYVKLGGGYTEDLQEAQVIGWKSRKNWEGGRTFGGGQTCQYSDFDILPVTIQLQEPT